MYIERLELLASLFAIVNASVCFVNKNKCNEMSITVKFVAFVFACVSGIISVNSGKFGLFNLILISFC